MDKKDLAAVVLMILVGIAARILILLFDQGKRTRPRKINWSEHRWSRDD